MDKERISFKSPALVGDTKFARGLARSLVFIVILLALGIMLLPWQQTVQGLGRVAAYSPNDRPQPIQAPISGRVEIWYVTEGSQVKAGDPVVMLTDNDSNLLARLEQQTSEKKLKLTATRQRCELAELQRDRMTKLFATGINSKRDVEKAQLELAKCLGELADARASLIQLETKIARQSAQFVKAARDGIIQSIQIGEGSGIAKSGEQLATLVPFTKRRAVEVWVNGNDAALISPGRTVFLEFEGWPAIQFSGWPNVSIGTYRGVVRLIDPSDSGDGKFRLLIVPFNENDDDWPDANFLRQGTRVRAWVQLEVVSLGFELWRRLNGFPPMPVNNGKKKSTAGIK